MRYYLVSTKGRMKILKECKTIYQANQLYKRYVETDRLINDTDSSRDYGILIKGEETEESILIRDYEVF